MKYKNIIARLKTQIPDAIPHPCFHQHFLNQSPTLIFLFLASCCFSPQLDPSTCHDKNTFVFVVGIKICAWNPKKQKKQVKLTFLWLSFVYNWVLTNFNLNHKIKHILGCVFFVVEIKVCAWNPLKKIEKIR